MNCSLCKYSGLTPFRENLHGGNDRRRSIIMRKIARIVQFCGVLALWLTLAAPYNGQSGVRLQGTYEYVVRPENHFPVFSARYNFDVIIAGCSWIISYEDLSASTNANLLDVRATASCDGTNIYFVQYQSESAAKHTWGSRYDSVKNDLPVAVAKIFPGNYPPPEEFILHTIWFAFGANCVLGSPAGKAKPVQYADLAMFYGDTNYFSGYFRTTGESNPTTHLITLTHNGFILIRHGPDWAVRRLKLLPPYDKGFVEGVGVWRGVTNISDVSVPNEFEYTGFAPKFRSPNPPAFEKTFTYRCIVTNVETAMTDEMPVRLPNGRVLVTDRRLANEGWSRITYMATNNWIPLEDVIAMARAQNIEKSSFESDVVYTLSAGKPPVKSNSAGIPPVKSNRIRYMFCFAIALPLVLWAIGAFWNKKHKNKERQ